MKKKIKLLIIEDSENDTLLEVLELRRAGFDIDFERVETLEDLLAALKNKTWDCIISDYRLPEFSGIDALEAYKRTGIDIPFILVSGKIGEEKAVAAMKAGAHDYVMKDNLVKLTPIVDRELREAANRRERKRAEEELRNKEAYFRLLTENSSDIIVIVDEKGTIVSISESCEHLLGYKTEELIGKSGSQIIHPDDIPRAIVDFGKAIITEDTTAIHNTFHVLHKDGSVRVFEGTGRNLLNNPVVKGFIMNLNDATERKQAEEALSRSEAYFRSVIENSSEVITILNADGTIRYESPSLERVMGYKPSERIDRNIFEYIHPDDLAAGIDAFTNSTRTSEVITIELRYRHKDGSWRFLEGVGQNLLENEMVKGIVVNFHDITERKQSEAALRQSEERFRAMAETSTAWIWEMDIKGNHTYSNRYIESMLGYSASEITGRSSFDFMLDDDRDMVQRRLPDLIASKQGWRNWVIRRCRKDGSCCYFESNAEPIIDANGEIQGYRGIDNDITERRQAEEEILTLSITDQLTGLLNRRGFLTLAAQQLKLSDRTKRGLIFFFADLDDLKWINDTFGHEEGDKALIETAFVLKETFRSSDIISRMGGDEFAILAIDPEEIDPLIITDRLEYLIDTHNNQANRKYKLSISIGFSFYDPEDPSSIDELMSRADKSMYEKKKNKKSRPV
jgi:diguanylate cyclase (GGDEF)-like protein/PAS domain S-box-containing protein